MVYTFKSEVRKLLSKKYVEQKTINRFVQRIQKGSLTKEVNPESHFCSFFLPVNLDTKSVYLGWHKKADDWIPPGGHIQENELPIQTVKREFKEELDYDLDLEKIELFDLSIKDVSGNPLHRCKIHYDFWYLVFIEKIEFNFEKREFYQAGWFTLDQALKKTKLRQFNEIIAKLELLFKL